MTGKSSQSTTAEQATAADGQARDSSWRPLLGGAEGELASAALGEIVSALPDPSATAISDASLAGGNAGLAVLCSYLCLADLDNGENAARFLDQAVEATASPMSPSFYGGFTGVAWAAAHIQEQLGETDEEDADHAIDVWLRDYLDRRPWRGDYDLISGLVGIGVYAIERLPRPIGVELLEGVIDRLQESAEHTPQGITWLTSPELLPPWQRALCPNGYYNVGLAHGVPGVIALLGQAWAAGVARARAKPLLDGAVAWLLAQKSPSDTHSLFPSWIAPAVERKDCRTAWCYGDAGVAAALFLAARCANEPTWESEALGIARQAAERSPEQAEVVDAGLCHGAAGLAHIFNRMFQATRETWLADAAMFWFDQTIAHRRPGEGIGGYAALTLDEQGAKRWAAAPGILVGAAGVALALLAAVTPVEPAWDRMFLVSTRLRGEE